MADPAISHFSFTVENTEFTFYHHREDLIIDSAWPNKVHMHPLHELFIMIDGEASVPCDSAALRLGKHDVCIIPPRYIHSVMVKQPAPPKRVALWFIYKKIKHTEGAFDFYSLISVLSRYASPMIFHAGETMISMLLDVVASTKGARLSKVNEVKLRNIFSLLFINLTENLASTSPAAAEQYPKSKEYYLRLAHLNLMVNDSFFENGSVKELASRLFLSTRQLSGIFKSEFGMTMKSYHYLTRMHRAAHLLVHTKDSVASIAARLGYASSEIFSIMFKRYFGVSATQFRKTHKGVSQNAWNTLFSTRPQ